MVLKTLRVAGAQSRDVGRGIARIDIEPATELGLSTGDVVEIKGEKVTAAIYWPGYQEDFGKSILALSLPPQKPRTTLLENRTHNKSKGYMEC